MLSHIHHPTPTLREGTSKVRRLMADQSERKFYDRDTVMVIVLATKLEKIAQNMLIAG